MPIFTVTEVIEGNKIRVSGWTWEQHAGTIVVITGYNPSFNSPPAFPTLAASLAKNRLISLLKDKQIELGKVIQYNNVENSITCQAFYNGIDISNYFPEYK